MDNKQIIEKIVANKGDYKKEVTKEETFKFVLCKIEDKLFAFPSRLVQEVVIDHEIYYLPFAPFYIRGLINRHGFPYSVVDLKAIFEKNFLTANKFLILKNNKDRLSFLISEILQIVNIDKSKIKKITLKNDSRDYFEHTILYNDVEVPVLDVKRIIKKIENDIE